MSPYDVFDAILKTESRQLVRTKGLVRWMYCRVGLHLDFCTCPACGASNEILRACADKFWRELSEEDRTSMIEHAQKPVYFVSGHLDLTAAEFEDHYIPKLYSALASKGSFVVGDAWGTDTMAQAWLKKRNAHVKVFHMLAAPRNNEGDFPLVGGFTTDKERDEALTAVSTHDIAWVRPGREKSGTAKNLARRKKL